MHVVDGAVGNAASWKRNGPEPAGIQSGRRALFPLPGDYFRQLIFAVRIIDNRPVNNEIVAI
jgi:hypothetical protein